MADELITQLQTLINAEANNNPAPIRCKITKVYTGNTHVDASTDIGTLTYVEAIGNNLAVGHTGIVVFLNGNLEEQIIITK